MTATVVGAVRVLSASGPTLEWRRGIEGLTGGASPRIQVRVGRPVFLLARLVLTFVPVEAEISQAVGGLRFAEVSVYQLQAKLAPAERAALMAHADHTLLGEGWERVVGVIDEATLVAVYVPAGLESGRDLRACVIVADQREMVVAAAAGDPEPLLKLALKHTSHPGGGGRELLSMAGLRH